MGLFGWTTPVGPDITRDQWNSLMTIGFILALALMTLVIWTFYSRTHPDHAATRRFFTWTGWSFVAALVMFFVVGAAIAGRELGTSPYSGPVLAGLLSATLWAALYLVGWVALFIVLIRMLALRRVSKHLYAMALIPIGNGGAIGARERS